MSDTNQHSNPDVAIVRQALQVGATPWDFEQADAAVKRLLEQLEALRKAAASVVEEWHFPNAEPPSETHFHDLVMQLEAVLNPASRLLDDIDPKELGDGMEATVERGDPMTDEDIEAHANPASVSERDQAHGRQTTSPRPDGGTEASADVPRSETPAPSPAKRPT